MLARVAQRERTSVSEIVRRAVDRYIVETEAATTRDEWSKRTLGTLPDIEVPSRDEWDRGYG